MKELDKIAKKIMLNVDENVSEMLSYEWDNISLKLKMLKDYQVGDIEPMVRISQKEESYLREDIIGAHAEKKLILSNAKNSNDDFIVLPKVVHND